MAIPSHYEFPWYKVKHADHLLGWHRDAFTEEQCCIWFFLYDLANMGRQERRGYIEVREGVPHTMESLARKMNLRMDNAVEQVTFVVEYALSVRALRKDENGCLWIVGWEREQVIPEGKSAEEKQAWKEQRDQDGRELKDLRAQTAELEYRMSQYDVVEAPLVQSMPPGEDRNKPDSDFGDILGRLVAKPKEDTDG